MDCQLLPLGYRVSQIMQRMLRRASELKSHQNFVDFKQRAFNISIEQFMKINSQSWINPFNQCKTYFSIREETVRGPFMLLIHSSYHEIYVLFISQVQFIGNMSTLWCTAKVSILLVYFIFINVFSKLLFLII